MSKGYACMLVLGGLAGSVAGSAQAAEVKFPKAHPLVQMQVPDNWTVRETPLGLELISPEKTAFVVADILKKDKDAVDAWKDKASGEMKSFGIKFDTTARNEAKAGTSAQTASVDPIAPQDASKSTFSGAPSLALPGTAGSNDPIKPPAASLEALTGMSPSMDAAPSSKSKLKFKAAQYAGTSLNGKPIDMQLLIFSLPKNKLLVMQQASDSTDGRTVAIVLSTDLAK